MNATHVKISDQDRKEFVSEIHYYILTVMVPLNLVFLAFFLFPRETWFLTSGALILDAFFYLTKIRPAYADVAADAFLKKRGILRKAKFRLSFEKFEYVIEGEPEIFSSLTSRHQPCLEHEVEVVYAEKSNRIIKMILK